MKDSQVYPKSFVGTQSIQKHNHLQPTSANSSMVVHSTAPSRPLSSLNIEKQSSIGKIVNVHKRSESQQSIRSGHRQVQPFQLIDKTNYFINPEYKDAIITELKTEIAILKSRQPTSEKTLNDLRSQISQVTIQHQELITSWQSDELSWR